MLQSGQIFIGKIPSDQIDYPPSIAISAGFVGCIEQVSKYNRPLHLFNSYALKKIQFRR